MLEERLKGVKAPRDDERLNYAWETQYMTVRHLAKDLQHLGIADAGRAAYIVDPRVAHAC